MAFTTTQRLDTALLRNLNFRTPLNVPISSQYTLYANGQGQTYWSNSVSPTDLSTVYSTLSSSVYVLGTATNSSVLGLQTAISFTSTSVGNLGSTLTGNVNQLLVNDSNFSNSVTSLSNNLAGLAYSNSVQINNIYNSTIQELSNTLNNYSNLSSFYLETSNLLGIMSSAISSLSTVIGVQNTSTYNVLTSNYKQYTDDKVFDVYIYVNNLSSYLYNDLSYNLSTQSSIAGVTVELLSSISSVTSSIGIVSTTYGNAFSTLYFSSIYTNNSTLDGHELRISQLETLSTNLSSISKYWISTYVSTSQGYQDIAIQSSVSSLTYLYSSLTNSTLQNYSTFNNFSTFMINTYTNINTNISTLTAQVSSLLYEYSILTTSSILGGIYSSFVHLEDYMSTVLWKNDVAFKSTLFSTSIVVIESTANSYFDYYQSTMYASTLSTLIPATQAYYSSIVSTTSYFAISTTASTMYVIANLYASSFYSTTSSLTQYLLDSTATQLNSSIQGNLVIPTQSTNIAYSTIFFSSLTTMLSTGYGQIRNQSTMFSSLYCWYSTSFSTLYIANVNQLVYMSSQIVINNSNASTQLLSNSTLFGRQLSTQNGIFYSSIGILGFSLESTIASTTNAIYAQTTDAANSVLNNIEISTIQTYNNFVTGLNNASSTITLSTLYTEQILNLTGSNSNAIMDMATYRNFNINIFNIANTGASYRLTYSQNTLLGLNYRTGFIFINVSTVGQSYTSNNSQLRFDAYQWGIPTTVFGNVFPYISNADYTLQYQYVIQNNVLFTNLMNVYPRIKIVSASYIPTSYNVRNAITNGIYSNVLWRGTPMTVSWSKYSFFPTALGAPPFSPQVLVDMRINNNVVAEYGPFAFEASNATVAAPYISGIQSSNIFETQLRVYIAGAAGDAATATFYTLLPTFDIVRMLSPTLPTRAYVGGTELVAVTDTGTYPLYSTSITMTNPSGQISYDNTLKYIPQNINNGLLNRGGAVGNNITSLLCSTSIVTSLTGLTLEPENLTNWNTIRTTNVTQTATQIAKTTTDNAWNATAYAVDGFASTIYIAASPNDNKYMTFGLDPSPAGKTMNQFAYSWSFELTTVGIYTSNTLRTSVAYSSANRYAIYYDGTRVQFLLNGVEQYSEARPIGAALYFGASFFSGNSILNNVVYSPFIMPVGILRDASQQIGSTTFFVNAGTYGNSYFSNISSLQRYGTNLSFTLSRPSTTIQFVASTVQLSSGTTSIWRIDTGIANSVTQLSSGTIYMNYNINNIINRISTSAFYYESTFCGPSITLPDTSVTVSMNSVNLTARKTPVSTILYYNLLGNPVAGALTNGMLIQGIITNGSSNFTSSFRTSGNSNVQIFNI
jgi:hypothetical protein